LGHTAVHEILRANDLKPHLQRTFKVSTDPKFSEKVQDIVGLYLNPPQNAVVVSLDEKTQFKLWIGRSRCSRSGPGRWSGALTTTSGMESWTSTPPGVATGRIVGACKDSHTAADFLRF